MKHVPRPWLRRLQLGLFALDVIILGLFLYSMLIGAGHEAQPIAHGIHGHGAGTPGNLWGITTLIAIIAGLHALYAISCIWWLDRKHTWVAHAISVFISGVMLVLLANVDNPLHIWYHALLMVFMFFAVMVGALVPGLIFALAFFFLIVGSLGSGHLTSDPSGHVIEMVLVSLSAVSASGGWFVFNKHYTQNADIKVVENLTKIVKQERSTVSLILESIADGVMIINPEGQVQILNASSARMLGWTKEEAQNLQYDSLLQAVSIQSTAQNAPTPPTQTLAIAETLKDNKPVQQVTLIKTRDGRQIYVDITASPIIQDEAAAQGANSKRLAGVIAVLRDVDKQKRDEQQRSEFISTASHEMRTPVAAIEGYLALAMNDKVSQIDSKARDYLAKAHSSTEHLGKLFQDLLTSAKAEDGRLVSHPVVIEMGEFLEQLTDSLKFAAEKKGLLVDFTIGASSSEANGSPMNGKVVRPLYYVQLDPDRMREALTNLFDNAVKYTETGKISVGLTGNNDVVQFYIRDTGPGIPPDDIPHLFQKFYRVDNSATRTIGGTGLGLFICRKIVELYKGRIWVESQLKQGSTFYINLPRMSNQKASELQTAETAQAANTSSLSS
jgi:PAS domain S-box-containing protein